MDIHENTIETKPLCISSSNLFLITAVLKFLAIKDISDSQTLVILSGYHLGQDGMLGTKVATVKSTIKDWLVQRREVLAPRWITGVVKLVSRGDAKVILAMHSQKKV